MRLAREDSGVCVVLYGGKAALRAIGETIFLRVALEKAAVAYARVLGDALVGCAFALANTIDDHSTFAVVTAAPSGSTRTRAAAPRGSTLATCGCFIATTRAEKEAARREEKRCQSERKADSGGAIGDAGGLTPASARRASEKHMF